MKLANKQKKYLFTRHEDTRCIYVHYKYLRSILMPIVEANWVQTAISFFQNIWEWSWWNCSFQKLRH